MGQRGRGRYYRGSAQAQFNMTPMIDVAFLLIVFFMLVSNLVAEENPQMIVPNLSEPQAQQVEHADRVFVNVVPAPFGGARMRGEAGAYLQWPDEPIAVRVGLRSFSPGDVAGLTGLLSEMRGERPGLKVLVRADAALAYEYVRPVLEAVGGAGIEEVGLVVYAQEQKLGR